MLAAFNELPVAPLAATCAVCMETYTMQTDNFTEFMMPTNCTHLFCYKCVINMYASAMNIPRASIDCPVCKTTVTTWQSFFPNTVVSCKFTKRTTYRVPPAQQFTDALKIMRERYAATADDIETANPEVAALKEQVKNARNENKHLQEQVKRARSNIDIANNTSRYTMNDLKAKLDRQRDQHNYELNCMQRELDSVKNEKRELEQTVQRIQAEMAAQPPVAQPSVTSGSAVMVGVDFNENARQNTNPHERFRSLVYSTVSELLLESRIQSLQNYVFGSSCVPCEVNIEVNMPFDG
ncbi:PE38 [Epiphyas postvittana nucleopolyhedrovirus]|uniref:PE38 n=1 Tax=Epiphyas postvittana nucleopolyhedrovirus TaxID=70600 RepID=Q91GC2_NPVEP|nr:PE38 [Epiphyas postvittana nucleopolyhedrovirus]AAK85697.1 PE38 [Epiphyas postvittana nucleopolyhedrovirus]